MSMALAAANAAKHQNSLDHSLLRRPQALGSSNKRILRPVSVLNWQCADRATQPHNSKSSTPEACPAVGIPGSLGSLSSPRQHQDINIALRSAAKVQRVQQHGSTRSLMASPTPANDGQQQQWMHKQQQLSIREPAQQLRRPNSCVQQQQQPSQHDLLLPLSGPWQPTTWQQVPQQQQQQREMLPHPFCTLDHRTLTRRIKQCESWHDAAVLFAQQSQCMNHINYAALITHLAQMGTSVRQKPVNWKPFISQVLAASEPHLNSCDTRQLSNMVWGLATLGFFDWVNPYHSWTALWQQRLQQQLHTASCRDTSNILWAVATSVSRTRAGSDSDSSSGVWSYGISSSNNRTSQPPLVLQQEQHVLCDVTFHQELLSALHRELPNSTPQDVSNTLWALATLNFQPSGELQQYLLIRVQTHSSLLKPREVAQTLWALAQLGIQPPSEWLRELLLKQISHPVGLVMQQQRQQQQDQGNTLWQIVAPGDGLQQRRQLWKLQRQRQRQQQRQRQRQRRRQRQMQLLQQQRWQRTNERKQVQRQSSMDTCCKVVQRETRQQMHRSCSSLQTPQQAAAAAVVAVADVTVSGSAAASTPRLPQSRAREAQQQRQQQQQHGVMHQQHAGNIVICLVSCARLKQLPPDKWIDQALIRLDELLLGPGSSSSNGNVGVQHCAAAVISSSSTTSPRGSQSSSSTACIQHQICNSSINSSSSSSNRGDGYGGSCSHDLANLIWALGSLGIKPHRAWLDKFLDASTQALPKAKPQELCNTIWGLARLDVTPTPSWLQGFDAASTASMYGFTAQGLADILACQVSLGLEPSGAWREGWIAALRVCWGSADAAAICKTLWAAAMLNLPLGKYWLLQAVLQAHGELQRALVNQELSNKELLNLVWAVGKLGRGSLHASVSDMLGLHCCRSAANMSWRQLIGVAQGLRKLSPLPAQRLVDYYGDLVASRVRYMPAEHGAQVQAALLLLRAAADRDAIRKQKQQAAGAWRQWQQQQQQQQQQQADVHVALMQGGAQARLCDGRQAVSILA